jgi:hypothetical protein
MNDTPASKFDTTKWTATIGALLANAEDPSLDEQTRQNYAAKAAVLMSTHNISADRLRVARETGQVPPESAELWAFAVSSAHGLGSARARCAEAIARAMACKAAVQGNRAPAPFLVAIVGAAADLDALRTLLPLVMRQAELAAMAAAAQGNRAAAYLSGFLVGYGEAVAQRITVRRRDHLDQTPGTDVVLASRAKQVEKCYLDLLGPYLGTRRGDPLSASGRYAGRDAGHGADLGDTRLNPNVTRAIGQ